VQRKTVISLLVNIRDPDAPALTAAFQTDGSDYLRRQLGDLLRCKFVGVERGFSNDLRDSEVAFVAADGGDVVDFYSNATESRRVSE
jgi:hypothetical protein